MQKLEQIYEGKAKKVFRTDDPELFIVSYKDDATAFNGLKKGTIAGKGAINNRMTNNLMRRLEAQGQRQTVQSVLFQRYGFRQLNARRFPRQIDDLLVDLFSIHFIASAIFFSYSVISFNSSLNASARLSPFSRRRRT